MIYTGVACSCNNYPARTIARIVRDYNIVLKKQLIIFRIHYFFVLLLIISAHFVLLEKLKIL